MRVDSYFDNSELKATGLPQGRELEILNEVRSEVPPEVFTHGMEEPRLRRPRGRAQAPGDGQQAARGSRLQAQERRADQCRRPAAHGRVPARISPTSSASCCPTSRTWRSSASRPACAPSTPRSISAGVDTFDFDIVVHSFRQSLSPGNEQRDFWGSEAAGKEGSRNVIGIKNPAIDKLIDKIILAKDRADLVAATRALDRVLLWNHYVVPQWHAPFARIAMWKHVRPAREAALAQPVVPARVVVGRCCRQAAGGRPQASQSINARM